MGGQICTKMKIIFTPSKLSRPYHCCSHASGSGADEGTGVTPGVPDAPDYDSDDDISWKSSDDDQDDEQDQDDDDAEKHEVHETTQEEEDDDEHDDDENDQEDDDASDDDKKAEDDDDEEMTESDNDGDDFVHPKLTTHEDEIIHEKDTDEDDSSISSSDEDDSDNDVEGAKVAGAKSGEDATDAKDQGNEAVKDSNTDLDGRDKVMTDVEDTHVTLTPVNPDGQQQSSSVSSGFVSNMLNPNQDTGVDDIFRQHTEATSLIDTHVTAIVEPSFTRPPTPHPIVIQPQQLPIMTPATTTSSLLENLPNFASLFGFDHRLKALEDNFSEFRQTNQYADALSSIPGTVDQYLANKMQEAVAVQFERHALVRYHGDKVTIKRPKDGADDDQEPSAGTDRGSKRRRSGKDPASSSAPSETTTRTAGQTTDTDVLKDLQNRNLKQGVHDDKQKKRSTSFLIGSKTYATPSPDHDEYVCSSSTCGRSSTRVLKVIRKKLNLTQPDTYRSNPGEKKDAYTPYSRPQEDSIYEIRQKDDCMRIDELHKLAMAVRLRFSDPMIQPEPEGSTQGYPLVSVEVLRFNTTDGNPVKKILLKLNLSDLGQSHGFEGYVKCVKVLKLKNFKKDATLKLFKNGMSMSVQKSQVHKVAKLQVGVEIMLG
ncbi:hypothetical protein Tco_0787378 [Tanacetum coccineum]